MASSYVSPWMRGDEAILHIVQVDHCGETDARAQLLKAWRDGNVDGRPCGTEHDWRNQRALESGEDHWRERFARGTARPEDVELRREAVLKIWPAGDGIHREAAERRGDQSTDATELERFRGEWMTRYAENAIAERGAPCKREDALAACKKETGGTYRTALAAWGTLPPHLKRAHRQNDRALTGQRAPAAR